MKYATMLNPYTGDIKHKVPIRYSTAKGPLPSSGPRLYTAGGGASGDAYFVSPDGEYVIIVNRYIDIAKFSDFDANGKYLGCGKRWKTVKEFRTPVDNVGWSPHGPELIYQYGNSFVTLDYQKNEVTRQLVADLKGAIAARIFWLRDNTIFFLNRKDLGRSLGILKF